MAANGRLPDSDLAPIAGGRLRRDAAAAWNAMNQEARRLGLELRPTGSRSSYRPLADQQHFWSLYTSGKGNLAARPGTSNHGLGLAVDVATPQMRAMIDRIGRKYGWAKDWSDAPSEWWHLKWREGVWSGVDPGPDGIAPAHAAVEQQHPPLPKGAQAMAIKIGYIREYRNGQLVSERPELFVEAQPAKAGEAGHVWHTWKLKDGSWWGAKKGKRNAGWQSLGRPGG